MTVKGPPGKKGPASKRNPCPPGSKKTQGGNKPHIQPPNKRKKPTPKPEMKKEDQERFDRKKRRKEEEKKARSKGKVIAHPKKPSKPKAPKGKAPKKGLSPLGLAKPRKSGKMSLDDIADIKRRIEKQKIDRFKNRRLLPGKL